MYGMCCFHNYVKTCSGISYGPSLKCMHFFGNEGIATICSQSNIGTDKIIFLFMHVVFPYCKAINQSHSVCSRVRRDEIFRIPMARSRSFPDISGDRGIGGERSHWIMPAFQWFQLHLVGFSWHWQLDRFWKKPTSVIYSGTLFSDKPKIPSISISIIWYHMHCNPLEL